MSTAPRSALLLILLVASSSLDAVSLIFGPAAPVSAIDYAPAGDDSEGAVAVVNGDRALVVWNRAAGATRIDEEGKPLDIPAIPLPKPQYTSGADVVADGDGWLVGWTIFWWKGFASESALRLARVTREGEVADVREIALPVVVPQNEPLHLATRGGVIVAAYRTKVDYGWRTIVAAESSHAVFDGDLRELTATDDGFAVLLRDRVVRLTADGAPGAVVTLPADFAPTHVARRDGETVMAGGTGNGIAVARLRDDSQAVEILARIPAFRNGASVAVRNGEITLLWSAAKAPHQPYSYSAFDLYAARVFDDGRVSGPQRLRDAVDLYGRWIKGPDTPVMIRVRDQWVAIWSEGPRFSGSNWRNLYAAPLSDSLTFAADPTLLTWSVPDQHLIGSALSGEVVLSVWLEPGPFTWSAFASRTTRDGRRIDAAKIALHEIGGVFSVNATNSGFVVSGPKGRLLLAREGPPVLQPNEVVIREIACTPEVCIAAWYDETRVYYARWHEGALLSPTVVYTTREQARGIALATDGERFLLAFATVGDPGGTLYSAAHIQWRDGALTHRLSEFAAAPRRVFAFDLAWIGDRYLAMWYEEPSWIRASHLTREGESMDALETSWEGWRVSIDAMPSNIVWDGTRTLLLLRSWQEASLYELQGRTPVPLARLPVERALMDCTTDGRCTIVQAKESDDPFGATRLFLRTLHLARGRVVRH